MQNARIRKVSGNQNRYLSSRKEAIESHRKQSHRKPASPVWNILLPGILNGEPSMRIQKKRSTRPGTVILNGKEIRMEEIAREKTWTKEEPRKLIPAEYKGTSGHPLSEAAETPMKLKLLLLPLACMFLAVLSHPAVSDADCIGRQRHRRFYRELLRRGVQVSEQVEAYRSTVERYAGEYGIRDYVNVLLAIMEEESGGRGTDVMQASESLGLSPNTLDTESSIR